MKHAYRRKVLRIIGITLAVIVGYFFVGWPTVDPTQTYGVTWSAPYARELGFDSMTGLRATLEDLHVTQFRIPVYWSEVEKKRGTFDWKEVDRELAIIAAHNGHVILSLGLKQPRWPECWMPDWAGSLSATDRETAQFEYVAAAVRHFVRHPAVQSWQVENEPFIGVFGVCGFLPYGLVKREIALVRTTEADAAPFALRHPIVSTVSGELTLWSISAGLTDGIGTSVYRVVVDPWGHVWRYAWLPSWFYQRRAWLVQALTGPVFVSEFQMEPWGTRPITQMTLAEQFTTFDKTQMEKNLWYAERLHLSPVYFWGVEWWYWMKVKMHHPEFWETMKTFLANHRY